MSFKGLLKTTLMGELMDTSRHHEYAMASLIVDGLMKGIDQHSAGAEAMTIDDIIETTYGVNGRNVDKYDEEVWDRRIERFNEAKIRMALDAEMAMRSTQRRQAAKL